MGFEIIYKFRKKNEDGGYSDEIESSKPVKLGKAEDILAMEVAVSKIMAKLANRAILVEDVEIYEYTKKKHSFKLVDDGILISGRKFPFDNCPVVTSTVAEVTEEQDIQQKLLELINSNPNILNQLGLKKTANVTNTKSTVPQDGLLGEPIRHEIFDPDKDIIKALGGKKLFFTKGKKYPIYREKFVNQNQPSLGMAYTVKDDKDEVQVLHERFFQPEAKLSGKFFRDEHEVQIRTPELSYGSEVIEDDAPILRR